MREFAKTFYLSKAWKQTRDAYAKQAGELCEECLSRGLIVPGEIVHHKTPLSPANINDPAIALDFSNLELVCRDCHAMKHGGRRWKVTAEGGIAPRSR